MRLRAFLVFLVAIAAVEAPKPRRAYAVMGTMYLLQYAILGRRNAVFLAAHKWKVTAAFSVWGRLLTCAPIVNRRKQRGLTTRAQDNILDNHPG
jgi:hypothetical protein